MPRTNFDRLARPYRWLEYLTFGPLLARCRFHRIPELAHARRALILGDGDGRFLARLLAANPLLQAEVVDQSPAMLRLLRERAQAVGAAHRIQIHQTDALDFRPAAAAAYDLVVTHFFLDCFTTQQVCDLARNLRPHLAPGALWIVSEFSIPRGPAALPAWIIVRSLYFAFRILTGLRVRVLPRHDAALTRVGLRLQNQQRFLFGVLNSEKWSSSPEARFVERGNAAPPLPFPTSMSPFGNLTLRTGEPAGPGIDPGPIPAPTPGPEPGPSPQPNLPVEPDPEPQLPPGPAPTPAPVT